MTSMFIKEALRRRPPDPGELSPVSGAHARGVLTSPKRAAARCCEHRTAGFGSSKLVAERRTDLCLTLPQGAQFNRGGRNPGDAHRAVKVAS